MCVLIEEIYYFKIYIVCFVNSRSTTMILNLSWRWRSHLTWQQSSLRRGASNNFIVALTILTVITNKIRATREILELSWATSRTGRSNLSVPICRSIADRAASLSALVWPPPKKTRSRKKSAKSWRYSRGRSSGDMAIITSIIGTNNFRFFIFRKLRKYQSERHWLFFQIFFDLYLLKKIA